MTPPSSILARLALLLVAMLALFGPAAADPCLEGDYAVENYGTCCAHGGYKIEGHKEVCRLAKAKLVKKREDSGI